MIFHSLPFADCYLVELERKEDDRGYFARCYCEEEFAARGLNTRWVQCNISYNHRAGTFRGMHYQVAPDEEIKLIRVTAGAVYDVIVDIREDSPTYRQWHGFELSEAGGMELYLPAGIAHGFLTIADGTAVHYHMSSFYVPQHARGIRWDDPAVGIRLPGPVEVISDRDLGFPPFDPGKQVLP